MWIIDGLLLCILVVLIWIGRELHGFAFVNSFNLTFFRRILVEKVLTEEQKARYFEALAEAQQKHGPLE
jgi:hypothetical protein